MRHSKSEMRRWLKLCVLTAGCVFGSFSLMKTAAAQGAGEVTGTLEMENHPLTLRPPTDHEADLQVVPEGFAAAVIRPGFLLELNVTDIPELSGIMLRVTTDGNIAIPDVGNLHVEGDSIPAAEAVITQALVQGQVLVAPQVRLNVLQYASEGVTVLGEVQSPGRLRLLRPEPLDDVLALAGGETISAGNDIEVQRSAAGGAQQTVHIPYTLEKHTGAYPPIVIYPGDTLFVHRAGIVYVMGAVNKPGAYLMVNGGTLSILQSVSLAGGTLLNAATRDVRILRPDGSKYRTIEVPYSKLVRGQSESVQLQANDILYVSHSRLKTVLLDGSYLLGTTLSGSLYRVP